MNQWLETNQRVPMLHSVLIKHSILAQSVALFVWGSYSILHCESKEEVTQKEHRAVLWRPRLVIGVASLCLRVEGGCGLMCFLPGSITDG